jgi:hypothetical protein
VTDAGDRSGWSRPRTVLVQRFGTHKSLARRGLVAGLVVAAVAIPTTASGVTTRTPAPGPAPASSPTAGSGTTPGSSPTTGSGATPPPTQTDPAVASPGATGPAGTATPPDGTPDGTLDGGPYGRRDRGPGTATVDVSTAAVAGSDGVPVDVAVTAPGDAAISPLTVRLPDGVTGRPTLLAGAVDGAPVAGPLTVRGSTLTWSPSVPSTPATGAARRVTLRIGGLAWPARAVTGETVTVTLGPLGAPDAVGSTLLTTSADTPCGTFRGAGWVAAENSRPGVRWLRKHVGPARRTSTAAYTSTVSGDCGSEVTFYVSTTAARYSIRAVRTGWYGGTSGRLLWTSPPLPGGVQKQMTLDPATGERRAIWQPGYTLVLPGSWPPGAYMFEVVPETGEPAYVPFTYTDSGSNAALLVQSSVLTWQAYNSYGGASLYRGPGHSPETRARVVSFQRPYYTSNTPTDSMTFLRHELPLISYAEQLGLDVTYWTDLDLDASNVAQLSRHRALVLLGHDEYWTNPMRRTVEAAVAGGMNLLSLGANQAYWRARVETPPGATLPSVTVYRHAEEDPVKDLGGATIRWRDAGEPESRLFGSMYSCLDYYGDGHVTTPEAWPFAGLPASARDADGTIRLPGVIGQEEDRYFPEAAPFGRDVQVLAHTDFPCRAHGNAPGGWDLTYSTVRDGHAGVLAVGTMYWVCSLDATCLGRPTDPVTAPRVRAITRTVLETFAAGPAGLAHPAVPNTRVTRQLFGGFGTVQGAGDGFDSYAEDADDDD